MENETLEGIRVANELYGLGLSAEDFQEIEREVEEFKEVTQGLTRDVDLSLREVAKKTLKLSYRTHRPEGVSPVDIALVDGTFRGRVCEISGKKFFFHLDKEGLRSVQAILDRFHAYEDARFKDKEALRRYTVRQLEEEYADDEFVKALFWLFDQKPVPLELPRASWLDKVLHVFEHENTRLFISRSEENGSPPYRVTRVTVEDPRYNYIDKGRLFYRRLFFTDLAESAINEDVVRSIHRSMRSGEDILVLEPGAYDQERRRLRLQSEKEQEETGIREAMDQEMAARIEKLDKKPFTYSGITFSRHFIEYADQKTGSEDLDLTEFISGLDFKSGELDFNRIYERFVEMFAWAPRPVDLQLGRIRVRLTEKVNTNRLGVASRLQEVNSIRINKDELIEVLKRAICFESAADYHKLLQDVHRTSLRFRDICSQGLQFDFKDDILDEERFVTFKIVRRSGRNFLVSGEQELLIRDSDRLITKSSYNKVRYGQPRFGELFAFFKDLFGLETAEATELFKHGLEQYTQVRERARKLVEETIKELNVEEGAVTHDGREYTGYIVKGKQARYFVDRKGEKVFQFIPGGLRYVCVVDKVLGSRPRADLLVSRLYALANDSLLAREVHTLANDRA